MVVPMNQKPFLRAGLLFGLLSVMASSAQAQRAPTDPIILWGVQRGCQRDPELSSAVKERIEALGTITSTVDSVRASAARCLGTECADLLTQACTPDRFQHGILLGGHVEDRYADGRYQARIRLWRVEFTPQGQRSFYRYERLDKPCTTANCSGELPSLIATWMGQLLEDSRANDQPVATLHAMAPPYCTTGAAIPAFLCAPFNLQSRCGEGEEDSSSTPASPTLHCPMAIPRGEVPSCDCSRPASCEPSARSACPQTPEPLRSPTLRRALGGSLLAAGGVLIGAGLLMTLNNYTSLALRKDSSCMSDEKCFVPQGGLAASWTIGVGLAAGGALILLDPLRLFRDRPAKSK